MAEVCGPGEDLVCPQHLAYYCTVSTRNHSAGDISWFVCPGPIGTLLIGISFFLNLLCGFSTKTGGTPQHRPCCARCTHPASKSAVLGMSPSKLLRHRYGTVG